MHDQRLGRHAAIDRPLRRLGHHHGILAAAAGVARPARHPHPQLRRRDVELLGAQFADAVHGATAAWAGSVLDIDHHLIARQVRRQRTMIAGGGIGPGLACCQQPVRPRPGRLVLGDGLLQILEPELQLIGCQLFGAATELVTRQALDQQPQFVVLGVQLAQHRLQHDGASSGRASRSICTTQ